MKKKIFFITVAILAIVIGMLFPVKYFIEERPFGLLQTKSPVLLNNIFWNLAFYTHIIFAGIALLVGWSQFHAGLRKQKVALHRLIGKIYIISVWLGSVSGIYVAFYATGGWIASLGFICLGLIWFYTTLRAYQAIKKRQIFNHQRMMIYSYAACFAAVTLRLYLPVLTILFDDFVKAYLMVAWLCWVPNMAVAYFLGNQFNRQKAQSLQTEVKRRQASIPD